MGVGSSTDMSSGSTTQIRSTAVYLLLSSKRLEFDGITGPDVFQAAEEPVTMSGDSRVVRPGRAVCLDMAHGAVENEVVGMPWQDGHLEADSGCGRTRSAAVRVRSTRAARR